MNITMIGCGAWGMALTAHLERKGHKVTVWAHSPEEAERLTRERSLPNAFRDVTFAEGIIFTNDRNEAIREAQLIVFAVASPFTRSTAESFASFIPEDAVIVSVTKGIEEATLMTQAEILTDILPGRRIVALSGPTHAEEVIKGLPTTIVSASADMEAAEMVQDAFISDVLRVYTNPDVLGVELGGSLKNVIALAAGVADGMGYGDNIKAALITRGIHEMSRLAIKMGAQTSTLYGLSGMGDLIVTCASMHSRNRQAGILMGRGMSMDDAMKEVGQVVEGVYSAKAAIALARKYEVSLPITEEVNKVLFENKDPRESLRDLMIRDARSESDIRPEDLPECWRTGNSH